MRPHARHTALLLFLAPLPSPSWRLVTAPRTLPLAATLPRGAAVVPVTIPQAPRRRLPSPQASLVARGGAFARSVASRLWPNTLCKFWGVHAAAWAAVSVLVAILFRSVLPLPLAAANGVLAMMLYRSQEDAGSTLALAAAVYFALHATVLWCAPLVSSLGRLAALQPAAWAPARALSALQWEIGRLRLWHTALALGSFNFALKARPVPAPIRLSAAAAARASTREHEAPLHAFSIPCTRAPRAAALDPTHCTHAPSSGALPHARRRR